MRTCQETPPTRQRLAASRILGHARVTITLDVYSHLFDDARHAAEIRARMAASAFAQLLAHEDAAAATGNGRVVALGAGAT